MSEPQDADTAPALSDTVDLFDDGMGWLRSLVQIMDTGDLGEVAIQDGRRRVRVRKAATFPKPPHTTVVAAPAAMPAANAAQEAAAAAAAAEGAELAADMVEVTSPMVGTFYRSPSPDADPFVQVGDPVGEDTTICIIEAMKVMNEIKAEVEGTVAEVLVTSGEAVEYGQPIVRIKRGA